MFASPEGGSDAAFGVRVFDCWQLGHRYCRVLRVGQNMLSGAVSDTVLRRFPCEEAFVPNCLEQCSKRAQCTLLDRTGIRFLVPVAVLAAIIGVCLVTAAVLVIHRKCRRLRRISHKRLLGLPQSRSVDAAKPAKVFRGVTWAVSKHESRVVVAKVRQQI